MKCPHCGAPMVEMIMSSVCSAECDLKVTPPIETIGTISHLKAISLWWQGVAIECVDGIGKGSAFFRDVSDVVWVRNPLGKWDNATIDLEHFRQNLMKWDPATRWLITLRPYP